MVVLNEEQNADRHARGVGGSGNRAKKQTIEPKVQKDLNPKIAVQISAEEGDVGGGGL